MPASDNGTTKLNWRCPFPAGSRIVSYARDSGGDEQDRSVDQQNAVYADFCRQFGLTLLHTFADRARPGSTTVGREGFEQLITYLHENPDFCSGVLLWKHNRFARDQLDSQFYKADLRRRGFTLHFLADDIPDAGDITHIFEALIEWKAARDLHDISTDAKRGLADLVTMKKPDGSYQGFAPGTPPRCFRREVVQIGTKRNGQPRLVSRWVPDPETWEKGRRAWAMRAAGASLREIAQACGLYKTEAGYVGFFRNRIYIGELHFGDMVLKDFVPALATREEWEAVQALAGRTVPSDPERHPRRLGSSFLLSSLVYCGECASLMRGRVSGRNRWRAYHCPKCGLTLSARMVEENVITFVANHVLTPAMLGELMAAWRAQRSTADAERLALIAAKRQELAAVKRALGRLLDQVEQGLLAGASVTERVQAREAERARLEGEIARLERQAHPGHVLASLPPDQVAAFADRLREKLLSGEPGQVRPVLAGFVMRLEAKKEGGRLVVGLPPSEEDTRLRVVPLRGQEPKACWLAWHPIVPHRNRKTERNRELLRLHVEAGYSLRQLMDRFGLSEARVCQILRRERERAPPAPGR